MSESALGRAGRLWLMITVSRGERREGSVTTVRVPLIQTEHGQVGRWDTAHCTAPVHCVHHHSEAYL